MKKKKAILWDPYLDVMGGGEQYCLWAMYVLQQHGYDITIAWPKPLELEIGEKFHIPFGSIRWDHTLFSSATNPIKRAQILASYDVLLTITNGSYYFSGAKHNLLYAMVPRPDMYPKKLLDKIKTNGWHIIANSRFTKECLTRWGYKSTVHYPMLAPEFLSFSQHHHAKKHGSLILCVGRFFGQLHTKQHGVIIEAFNELQRLSEFKNYTLIMAGGLKDEDAEYFATIHELSSTNPNIILMPNVSHETLLDLYHRAQFFWHFTGYGINENIHPEAVEHLGITPLEAMASGCVVCCVNKGGPTEIIEHNQSGILFDTTKELITHMQALQSDPQLQSTIQQNAQHKVHSEFSQDTFANNLLSIIRSL